MGGIGFLLAINIALSLGFAAKFAAMAWFDKRRTGPRWMAAGFALGTVYVLAEVLVSLGIAPLASHMLGGVGFTVALSAFAIGLGHHYANTADPRLVGAVVAISVPLYFGLYFLPRDDLVRQIGYQAPYIVLVVLATVLLTGASGRRGVLDRLLLAALVLNIASLALRPLTAAMVGGVGARPQDYAQSLYGMISQSSGGILVLVVGILAFLVMLRDIAVRLMARAEQDEETGLYTPRGLEARIAAALDGRAGPQALMMVGIVPTGPDTGQAAARVAAVLDALRAAAPPWAIHARLGNSVFAVFDPAANVLAARRTMHAFVAAAAGPDLCICVGIAETEADDVPSALMARGETALAEAYRSGGDSVRIAPRSNLVMLGQLIG